MTKQATADTATLDEDADLKTQLAEIATKKAAISRARQEREERAALRKQIEDEQLSLANEEAIARAEEELGELDVHFAVTESPGGVVITKRPNHLRYKQFQDAGKFTTVALDKLVRPCRFYPDEAKFDALLEEYPGLLVRVGNAVTELANGRRKDSEGKF